MFSMNMKAVPKPTPIPLPDLETYLQLFVMLFRRRWRVLISLSSQITMSGHKQEGTMKHFTSIEKIDTGILYVLELTSSISVLLLAFGLIASMANVLTKSSELNENIFMQGI